MHCAIDLNSKAQHHLTVTVALSFSLDNVAIFSS